MRAFLLITFLALAVQVYSNSDSDDYDYELASIRDMFEYNVEKFIDSLNEVNNKVSIIVQQNGDKLQRKTWEQVGKLLEKIKVSANDLQPVDERIRDLYSIEIEESSQNLIETFNDFAFNTYQNTDFYQGMNHDIAKQLVAKMLEDYVNSYTGIINQCADEHKSNLLSFDNNVQNVAKKYQNIMKYLMAQVERCQQSTSLVCQQAASLQFRSLNKAPRDFRALTIEGYGLNADFNQTDCIKRALNDSNNEQKELLEKINQIKDTSNQGSDNGVYNV